MFFNVGSHVYIGEKRVFSVLLGRFRRLTIKRAVAVILYACTYVNLRPSIIINPREHVAIDEIPRYIIV